MDMIVNVGRIITDLYDVLARRNDAFRSQYVDSAHTSRGLLFSVAMRAEHNQKEIVQRAHFIIATTNVSVWIVTTSQHDPFNVPWAAWKNTSNHDSCWQSDGVLSPLAQAYFALCDAVQCGVPEDQRVAPAAIRVTARLGFIRPFEMVRVRYVSADNYGYVLTDVAQIQGQYVEVGQ